jgi:hypothetical protein
MSDTNCPYCGEPEETDTPSNITIYRCGTQIFPNNSSAPTLICDLGKDLRREREAHNQTKRKRDEARQEINNIRKTLSESGEAIGNGVHDFSIIEMVKNIIQSKNYFIQKSDSAERERDEAIAIATNTTVKAGIQKIHHGQ